MFSLSSCKGKSESFSDKKINLQFKGDVIIKTNDNIYSCNIVRSNQSAVYIKFITPDEIKGISYEMQNGYSIISYDNLKYEKNKNILYENSFISSLIEILDFISLNESELNYITTEGLLSKYSAVVNNKNFNIYINNDTGFINKIELNQDNFVFEFDNLSNIN